MTSSAVIGLSGLFAHCTGYLRCYKNSQWYVCNVWGFLFCLFSGGYIYSLFVFLESWGEGGSVWLGHREGFIFIMPRKVNVLAL